MCYPVQESAFKCISFILLVRLCHPNLRSITERDFLPFPDVLSKTSHFILSLCQGVMLIKRDRHARTSSSSDFLWMHLNPR